MDDTTGGGSRRQRSTAVLGGRGLAISRSTEAVAPTRVIAGFQAGLLLLLLVGCATLDWRDHSQQERGRQDLLASHPEWPPGMRAAVASGVISAGMSPEMVRAAWGQPTRTAFEGNRWQQRDTWHYVGRQHNADLIGGQTGGAQPLGEWTVSFANGEVVGWTE